MPCQKYKMGCSYGLHLWGSLSICFDISTIEIRVNIRVCGLHTCEYSGLWAASSFFCNFFSLCVLGLLLFYSVWSVLLERLLRYQNSFKFHILKAGRFPP